MTTHRVHRLSDDATICGKPVRSVADITNLNRSIDCPACLAVARTYREWIRWPTHEGVWWVKLPGKDADVCRAVRAKGRRVLLLASFGYDPMGPRAYPRGVKFQRAQVEPPSVPAVTVIKPKTELEAVSELLEGSPGKRFNVQCQDGSQALDLAKKLVVVGYKAEADSAVVLMGPDAGKKKYMVNCWKPRRKKAW